MRRKFLGNLAVLCAAAAVACSGKGANNEPPAVEAVHSSEAPSAAPAAVPPVPSVSDSAMAPGSAPAPLAAAAEPPTQAAPKDGQDLVDAARELYRVAACGSTGDIPAPLDPKVIAKHCDAIKKVYARYQTGWISVAKPFISDLRPKNLPTKVVYPFGGGDLVTALSVYPDAEEYTTISLEQPGDVRHIQTILPIRLQGALNTNGRNMRKLLGISYSNTINLGKGGRAWLPGEIVLLLTALAVHGYEPTSLRYFHIQPDGSLHYFSAQEVVAEGNREPVEPEGAGSRFDQVEIGFRKIGVLDGPEKIVRHIAQDLSNEAVAKNPGILAYLEAKGPVSVMTKAASHLLWADDFSTIRDYLLKHAAWMISDSTGIPPRFAKPAGFVQDTYGVFAGPAHYGPINIFDRRDFKKLFADNPQKPLPFAFGYSDSRHHSHMIIMRKPDESAGATTPAPSAAAPATTPPSPPVPSAGTVEAH